MEKRADANPARRYRLLFLAMGVLLAVVFVASFTVGRYPVALDQLPALFAVSFADWVNPLLTVVSGGSLSIPVDTAGMDSSAIVAFQNVRFPRILVAVMVGAALSLAGAAYQGMFQNPMASQDVLGASSGAGFGAALGILWGLGAAGTSSMAFVFGLAAVLASYAISKLGRSNPVLSMILAGMVISALFSAGTSFIKLVADTEEVLPAITYWLMGSLTSVRNSDVGPVFLLLLAATVPLVVLRWRLNLLATGEEEAKSLGLNAEAMRVIVIVCATFLTATCVSVSGIIGWVGLVIPHFARLLFGYDYRRVIPATMVMGSAFLLVVDDVARMVSTSEIPIGILTAFIGAPVFLFLIAKGGGGRAPRR